MTAPDLAVEQKLSAARFLLSELRPYFSHAIFGMILVEKKHSALNNLAWDEYWRVYYHRDWVASHSVPDIVVALYVALSSLLRDHFTQVRVYGVSADARNLARVALQAEIDDDVRDDIEKQLTAEAEKMQATLSMFDQMIFASHFDCEDGALWSYYYEHLLTHSAPLPVPGLDGANGGPRLWDDPPPSPTIEGLDDGDRRDIQRLVAEAIVSYPGGRGTVAGQWTEWADSVLKPAPIPWDQQMDVAMRSGCDMVWGHVRPIYTRPGRRSEAFDDFKVPAWRKPRPLVVFVGDTSGSMQKEKLLLTRGVVEDLARTMGARIAFVATDAEVHGEPQYVDENEDMPIEMRGRGGTDMRVGIEWVLANIFPTPNVIVVGTDGETPWPDHDVGVNVIAAIVDNKDAEDPPSWITRIDVKPMKKHLSEN